MAEEKVGFFKRLVSGLSKTRDNFVSGMDSIFHSFSRIDDDFYEELEETLIMGDLGVNATYNILDDLKDKVKERHIKDPMDCRQILIDSIKEQMNVGETAYEFENQTSVVMVIGVNGVGKTTTIGKLAGKLKAQNKKVIMAAADTFRAAAGEQLKEWANRAQVDIISSQEGSDPASVVYDAVQAAKARHADVLLCDTAGRLHNKKNLMEELRKMNRIIDREFPDAFRETLVVLDATTGQNALQQAKDFNDVADITGIVLTKMDGTAKGGIAVAIQSELGIPVKYIGVGETIDDLQKFDADTFVNALFAREQDDEEICEDVKRPDADEEVTSDEKTKFTQEEETSEEETKFTQEEETAEFAREDSEMSDSEETYLDEEDIDEEDFDEDDFEEVEWDEDDFEDFDEDWDEE